eukprot:scaffold656830_cov61-Prasinocladus_malaysianus.AAC.1
MGPAGRASAFVLALSFACVLTAPTLGQNGAPGVVIFDGRSDQPYLRPMEQPMAMQTDSVSALL